MDTPFELLFATPAAEHAATHVPWTLMTLSALLIVASVFFLWRAKTSLKRINWLIGLAAGLFAFVQATFVISRADHAAELSSAPTRTVEGPIEHFHAMPFEGHDLESFSVAGVRFEFSDYVETGGYNQTVSHGGNLKPGMYVRLTFVERGPGNRIITNVEVRK